MDSPRNREDELPGIQAFPLSLTDFFCLQAERTRYRSPRYMLGHNQGIRKRGMRFFGWVILGLLGVWLYARFAAFLADLFDGDRDYHIGGLESYKRCCENTEIDNLGHCAGCGMDWTL